MDEIRCDGCGRRFDGDSLDAASAVHWLIADAILCPCCAESWEQAAAVGEWEKAETYGRHHRDAGLREAEKFWCQINDWDCGYGPPPWGWHLPGAHRLTETRRMTVAELRLAVTG